MSYLNKYKVGSPLFRTLSEGRMRLNALRNAGRYDYRPPNSIIKVQKYLATYGDSCIYDKRSELRNFQLPESTIEPEAARPILEQQEQVAFPETFVLRLPGGRVLGDGTVVTPENAILSESTTDFHRKQEHHHLLSEYNIPTPEHFEGRLAVVASPGSGNYFHWTLDSIPRLHQLRGLENQIDGYYVDNRSSFHREWLSLLGIPSSKIISASPERHIQASELIVPSFAGLPGLPSPDGLDFVRSFMPTEKGTGKRIYISRSGTRRRHISNENKILPLLEHHRFEVVHPGKMTVAKQMKMFASADIIVSPHGAELTNLVYCRPGTKVIEFFSPYYLNPCFKHLAVLRGVEYLALVGKGGTRVLRKQLDAHHVWANIKICPLTLVSLLESMLP
ncbi:MAG: glycosyltransferase family 61 protein [Pontiella sp.]